MRLTAFAAALLLACNLPVAASMLNSLPGGNPHPEATLTAPIPPGDTELWQQRANAGDAYAQWVVSARLLRSGPAHRPAALAALRLSAENGYAKAALDWGRILLHGKYQTPVDAPEGLRWIESAEQNGNTESAHVLAQVHWNGWAGPVDRPKAVQWFQRAAESGWAPARAVLGLMLRDGIEIAPDAREAVRWLELAANQGRPEAKFALAEMLSTGQGIARDDARALGIYRELAQTGYLPAEQKAGERPQIPRRCGLIWRNRRRRAMSLPLLNWASA
jgi:TPR repeat protein